MFFCSYVLIYTPSLMFLCSYVLKSTPSLLSPCSIVKIDLTNNPHLSSLHIPNEN